METFTLEPDAQERISVEELGSLIFKILKRNLSTRKRITSYYRESLQSIMSLELLRLPGGGEIKRHPSFERKFARAVQMLRDKSLIMQDYTQPHAQEEFVELTENGEKMESEQFLPTVESSDKMIDEIESSAGPLDEVAEVYLRESLETFKSNFLISSAFCLGAMSERYILLLAEAVEADLNDPGISRVYSNCRSVKHYAKFISDNLNKLRRKHPGNDVIFRELDTMINTLSGYYRMTRNEAGHPEFVPNIERLILELALRTVPKYLDTILRVMKLLIT